MSEVVSTYDPQQSRVTVTESAVEHIKRQIKRTGHGIGLRFGIRKSGCSGYAYDVKIIDEVEEGDKSFTLQDGLILAVAHKHLPILQGTEIDYIQDGVNHRFQFNNPNETASCGCGESFTVDDEEDPPSKSV